MPTYSHSKLEVFQQCPLKFKLKYLDRLETDVENIELFLGNRLHEALEMLYRDLWDGRLLQLDDLINFYEDIWEGEWHGNIRIVRSGGTVSDYFDYGLDCISNYYRENHPFNQSRTMSLEESVEFNLDWAGQRRFQGRVDRISSRRDGIYEIHDYKTGRKIPDQAELMDDRQLTLYQVAVQEMHPKAAQVELVWHFLSRGVSFRLRRTQSDLLHVLQDTNRLVDRIECEERFPANTGPLCDWCEFRNICPAWR